MMTQRALESRVVARALSRTSPFTSRDKCKKQKREKGKRKKEKKKRVISYAQIQSLSVIQRAKDGRVTSGAFIP